MPPTINRNGSGDHRRSCAPIAFLLLMCLSSIAISQLDVGSGQKYSGKDVHGPAPGME
jgi:hypothetical protein